MSVFWIAGIVGILVIGLGIVFIIAIRTRMDADPGTQENQDTIRASRFGGGMVIGMAIGVAIGVALDSIAIGVAIGAGIGTALGAGFYGKTDTTSQAPMQTQRMVMMAIAGAVVLLFLGLVVFMLLR